MAKKKAQSNAGKAPKVEEFRHKRAKRKNNPPAKIAAEGIVPVLPKAQYSYSPRRPPVLRFDETGGADALPELLQAARERPLTAEEARVLAEALRTHEPWLEWAGKRELPRFAVDPVALNIHERISAQAILKVAARQDVQRSLFGDPEQAYHEAVQFYRHDIAWTNRMILGDSLSVMSSLARREDLAGKVQMIYIDPPYGIKFASNFQPEIGRRDVKDKETDLTREPEMVKAYRDTWHLGIHSYLKYLRDRLVVARDLLADTGSIFVQIGDENVHRVRGVLDEVFGPENFVSVVPFKKTGGQSSTELPGVVDFLLWFSKQRERLAYRQLYFEKIPGEVGATQYEWIETELGDRMKVSDDELAHVPSNEKVLQPYPLVSMGTSAKDRPFDWNGQEFKPSPGRHWSVTAEGLNRLARADRLMALGKTLRMVNYLSDYNVTPYTNLWTDTQTSGFAGNRYYVVQTLPTVIARCLLMTSAPGDLVLDPTCGSGTTAYVAEQWGRRWITIDTSRVAISIARQRLLTGKFDRYRVKGENGSPTPPQNPGLPAGAAQARANGNGGVDPHPGFVYKTVPHITLKSIAQNTNLDPIFARHEPILDERLAECNTALAKVTNDQRNELARKLVAKQREQGARSITDADRRRWELPMANAKTASGGRKSPDNAANSGGFQHWTVPFDTDPDWPKELQASVTAYRAAWRAKMDEVNACISANAEQEELVDQPEIVKGVVRVSGPFTVEAVQPPEMSLGDAIPVESEGHGLFGGEPEALDKTFADGTRSVPATLMAVRPIEPFAETQNLAAYLDYMVRLLRQDGVRFPNNKELRFSRLEPIFESGSSSGIHAEGRWAPVASGGRESPDDDSEGRATVGVAFGPQYGPVTAKQVEELIRPASRRYEALVIAGFSFDGPAQQVIEEAQHPNLRIHAANIQPDVNPGMKGLLKDQPGAQLFTVFGQPRTSVQGPDKHGEYTVSMEGVDIYNPVENSITATGADKVAAWFLDGDYDGRTFCVTQAFFPDRSAWDKLARALGGVVDEAAFEALSGTVSLPFPAGSHKCVAVKVIDPRGNEVMQVHRLT
ncbi:MAG: site-specific DNA-methyltransferase [Pirellulales bacterium]